MLLSKFTISAIVVLCAPRGIAADLETCKDDTKAVHEKLYPHFEERTLAECVCAGGKLYWSKIYGDNCPKDDKRDILVCAGTSCTMDTFDVDVDSAAKCVVSSAFRYNSSVIDCDAQPTPNVPSATLLPAPTTATPNVTLATPPAPAHTTATPNVPPPTSSRVFKSPTHYADLETCKAETKAVHEKLYPHFQKRTLAECVCAGGKLYKSMIYGDNCPEDDKRDIMVCAGTSCTKETFDVHVERLAKCVVKSAFRDDSSAIDCDPNVPSATLLPAPTTATPNVPPAKPPAPAYSVNSPTLRR